MSRSQANRLIGAAALVVTLGACDSATPPTTTQPSATTVTVSGVALGLTATGETRSVPNLRLHVRTGNYSPGNVELADTVTDSNGRYTIAGVFAPSVLYFQTGPGSEYRFACDTYPIFVAHPTVGPRWSDPTDLPVVHTAWSDNWPPPHMRVTPQYVWGTVSEPDRGDLLPVEGATVRFGEVNAEPPATTNATGFYMICAFAGSEQSRLITAQKTGYSPVTRQIIGGDESVIHFELNRK